MLEQAHARWKESKTAQTWQPVTAEVFDTLLQLDATYFLLYEPPAHIYLNRAYQTLGQPLKTWLDEQIELNGEVGLDIWILPEQQGWLISCNHDGDIFANTSGTSPA
ncbi:hypothetical protein [Hymenobacter cellulosilyticus]|uniref:Uncharacterized protein n=1 Tax=Hymenobacter cellulosilyticus TaxID=2932248 RepID=A0A8T9Q7G8_9BACT|nr:hypothetical protein [Hymenobacter cellulosilyticus]UOQ70963.1 hypothetical protein MUN79_20130 [Hymenobacter cellulosilyticus]